MPWTPAQKRKFGVLYREGKLSKKQFDKMMHEGTRRDVDRTGHARKSKRKTHRR